MPRVCLCPGRLFRKKQQTAASLQTEPSTDTTRRWLFGGDRACPETFTHLIKQQSSLSSSLIKVAQTCSISHYTGIGKGPAVCTQCTYKCTCARNVHVHKHTPHPSASKYKHTEQMWLTKHSSKRACPHTHQHTHTHTPKQTHKHACAHT